jgi:hypothetical protein
VGYTLYPPKDPIWLALRTAFAAAPLLLVTIVARRIGRGWLVSLSPWILVAAAFAVYALPVLKLYPVNRGLGAWMVFGHLLNEVAPIAVIIGLALLAILGAKSASTRSEPA